jgi:hypothetical protein
MSDLLNSASLVVIPSGYKEDTVYSVVPSDGSGDLSFTRASNGTRVNSAGLVEVCPWNLIEQSESFNNAYWIKDTATITANDAIAPNGTTTADKVLATAGNGNHGVYNATPFVTNFVGEVYTYSVYAKKGNVDFLVLDHFPNYTFTWFNLNTGTVGTVGSGVTATIESVGNGWYRCSCTKAIISTSNNFVGYYLSNANNTSSFNATGNEFIYLWGAQSNYGSTAKPYFPTTDRLNVPRLTYQNGGGGCPSLLLEKQSTNDFTYSEEFDNAAWVKVDTTITANTTISPDGTQNADTMTTTAGTSRVVGNILTGAGTFTISCYVKRLTGNDNFQFRLVVDGANQTQVFAVTDEWQRFTFTVTAASSVTSPQLRSAGAGTGTFAIWGAQFEASSYPTSYINTTSASATRVADVCFKTGISSLIGQTEGTLFADIDFKANTGEVGIIIEVNSGASNQRVLIYYSSTTILCFANAGVFSYSQTTSERLKIAFAYKSGDSALYVNGVQKAVSSDSLSYSSLSQLNIGSNYAFGQPTNSPTNEAVLFKTRLTNAEIASLTTI